MFVLLFVWFIGECLPFSVARPVCTIDGDGKISALNVFVDAIDSKTCIGGEHNVVVVGYHPDGTLIYMDPELGYLCEASEDKFCCYYYVVRGIKNDF